MNSLTTGRPYQVILRFAMPILFGSLFQQFYNMADAFIVSRTLGVEAFAGVSSTGGLSALILGFAQGMTAGVAIPLSKSFGANDREDMKNQYLHNFLICLVLSAVLTVIATLSTGFLLKLLRTPDAIMEYAYSYLSVLFYGITASMLFNFFANTLRAVGDSKTPLKYLMLSSILNIGLDVAFIRVLGMGASGVALATIIAQFVSALLCYSKVKRTITSLTGEDSNFRFSFARTADTLKIGIPMGFQTSIIAIGVIVMQFATNQMGTAAVAAYAAASKIDGIAVEPLRAVGITMTTYTAQNQGSGNTGRILQGVRHSLWLSIVMAVLLGIVMYFFGDRFAMVFVGSDETEIVSYAHRFLIIHGSLYIILSLLFIYRYTLQGLGYTMIPTAAGLMELLMRVVSAFWLVPMFQFAGASFATPLSWAGALVPVMIAWVHSERKMKQAAAAEDTKNLTSAPKPAY